jgi:SAM-dependent methyltransferase
MLAPEIAAFYARGLEEARLTAPPGRLEWLRTWEILERHLPAPPARILDIGGAAGAYALPLAGCGHHVRLIDPVPLHVERARALSAASATPLASVDLGDARALQCSDRSVDAVLMLGPLYHLGDRADRVRALAEARRVLAPGGVLFSASISRFASACDGIKEGALRDETFAAIVRQDLAEGIHRNPTRRPEWFTTAYFHRPEEIQPEIEEAGLRFEQLIAVEGPGWMQQDLDGWLQDEPARGRLLDVLRRVETEPSLIGVSAHILAISRR